MNITNEQLYEMILEIKAEQAEFKIALEELKAEQVKFKIALEELKTAQMELRADITKWGLVLFVGSIVAMTSILGVLITSILLTVT